MVVDPIDLNCQATYMIFSTFDKDSIIYEPLADDVTGGQQAIGSTESGGLIARFRITVFERNIFHVLSVRIGRIFLSETLLLGKIFKFLISGLLFWRSKERIAQSDCDSVLSTYPVTSIFSTQAPSLCHLYIVCYLFFYSQQST